MDLMKLLYKHQVALIQADELSRAGHDSDTSIAGELAVQIRRVRQCLGVTHYEMALAA
ncbi:hypothetical protein [Novosphingobium sp.]|uniref:hypothetical protein n=1 Tax=Novosphingobium sp. TaxID=1874826 RepID=UPI00286B8463|nr:hypothetical protein [Novosphingobium sp.]